MLLPVRRLHQLAAEKAVDGRKPARIGMPPGRALDRGKALRGKLRRDCIHADIGMNDDVERILRDNLAPAIDRQRPLHETIAQAGRLLGCGVLLEARVVAEDPEAPAIDLAQPAADGDFPNGVMPEESADDAKPDGFVRVRRRRERRLRITRGHDPAHQRTIDAGELAIVVSLVGEKERLGRSHGLGPFSRHRLPVDVCAQRFEVCPIGRAAGGDLRFILVEDG
jgi:hypothetical protein